MRPEKTSVKGRVDLHVHTTASDGTWRPAKVVREALELGLEAVGIADHDTVEGLAEAMEEGRRLSLEIVPGVEINTEDRGKEIHLLGYYVEPTPQFTGLLQNLRQARFDRMVEMVDKLRGLGMEVSRERILEIAGDAAPGRPHAARALVEKGYVQSVREAFERYLDIGRPAYVERFRLTPARAVEAILAAGGVPVLAHPGLIGDDLYIPALAEKGLKGLEVYHPAHDRSTSLHYLKMARRYGLLATGGSDCHGPAAGQPVLLGTVTVPCAVVEELQEARQRRSC